MTNSKTTRRALVLSLLSLLLCCSMLVGTTFAWFTDSVTSGNNQIVAGNLDIELYNDVEINDSKKVGKNTALFEEVTKWEPGVVAYENLTVANVGTLALDYKLSINFTNGNVVNDNGLGLADVLQIALVEGGIDTTMTREQVMASVPTTKWTAMKSFNTEGTLLPTDDADVFGLVICWVPGDNDNAWNVNNGKTTSDGKPLHIDLGINLFATQETYEEDSFDHLYDENANASLVGEKELTGIDVDVYDLFNAGGQTGLMTFDFTNYIFEAEKFQSQYPKESYADWTCDFFVSSDKALNAGVILVGNYADYGWLGFRAPASTEPYDPTGLLGMTSTGGVSNWTYEDICDVVQIFQCGIIDEMGNNAGTEVTVVLRMTSPDKSQTIDVCSVKAILD